ncbi:uracil-DNA glycosylase [Trichoderma harzianum]|uniref:Uracil-DNA glycosylase n=1 Tax=Trichoderma harzianum TaxID=5544 RepID=A0A0F9X4Z2_TRIHA|nr:uracil-DNA glycosylase [Trichoderma harzianum]
MSNLKRKAASTGNETEAKKTKANGSIASFFGAVPKPAGASAVSSSPAAKFDKAKWVEGLTAEQKELLKLEIETLHDSWLALLKDDVTTKEFLELKKFLNRETAAGKKWFPPKEDVYSWSRHTPFNEVKVVIVGQDPYHNVNQAHGMAFSVRPPTPAPPSLRNMYIALKKDYPNFVEPANRGGLLIPWADRGVLMLNTCLTVRAHEANSHANRGWERFTQKVIDLVAQKRTRGVVFMAWGTPASKRVQKVDKQRHLVLLSVHPSPLSASRGFFDCGHFKSANEWLISRYGDDGEIDWALRPDNTTKKAIKEAPKKDSKEDTAASTNEEEKKTKEEDSEGDSLEKPKSDAKTNGESKAKKPELDDEEDVDSDEEAALEEALRIAEEKIKN